MFSIQRGAPLSSGFLYSESESSVGARRKGAMMKEKDNVCDVDVGTAATSSSCCDNSVSRTLCDNQHLSTNRRGNRDEAMEQSALEHQGCVMNSSSAGKFNSSSRSLSASAATYGKEKISSRNIKLSSQSTSNDDVDASTSSNQRSGKRKNKLILLRRSVQYTTQLKTDPSANDDTPNFLQSKDIVTEDKSFSIGPTSSHFTLDIPSTGISRPLRDKSSNSVTISKPLLDGAYDLFALPTGFSSASSQITSFSIISNRKNVDSIERTSSFFKFDRSSSWISKDTASTSSTFSDQVDGAYDLFSLPSDSSISPSRCDSNRSLDYITSVDRLSLHDDISECSISKHRKVSFDSTVKAATIPSRLSYSSRMKTRLWSSTEDIYSNALRNEKEFAFDGCDWRTASEESDFLLCPFASSMLSDDVFVHPVHFVGLSKSQSILQQSQVLIREDNAAAESEPEFKVDNLGGIFDMD